MSNYWSLPASIIDWPSVFWPLINQRNKTDILAKTYSHFSVRNKARILLNATIVNYLTTFTKLVYQKLTRDADASKNSMEKMSL